MIGKDANIFVAGHKGMVGSSIIRSLKLEGYTNIQTAERVNLDLLNQNEVNSFFSSNQIDYVIIAAAKVGGIYANNTFPAEFIYNNLMIECNLIHAAHYNDIHNLLFLGSSCIYPVNAKQPMKEEYLLGGLLEPTNEPYAIAKIAGIKLCESYNRQYGRSYLSLMPTNLYGPNDNFNLETSHVLPALIRRFHEATQNNKASVVVWGTGSPLREFLHVYDLASACVFIMEKSIDEIMKFISSRCSHINIGQGTDISIRNLALLISQIIGFKGEIKFDISKPDGPLRKLLDVNIINQLGWSSSIDLEEGIGNTYNWYKSNQITIRR